jgi:hypothetical protein
MRYRLDSCADKADNEGTDGNLPETAWLGTGLLMQTSQANISDRQLRYPLVATADMSGRHLRQAAKVKRYEDISDGYFTQQLQ